jgi:CPA2 family monovalent cation:H+ antiporter-2
MGEADLITNMAVALGLALVGGVVARALRLPTIVGYLAAGVAMSPFTPGPAANVETLRAVAELGVIFLMFGIGLGFDLRELRQVRGIVAPGALLLGLLITAAGAGVGRAFGLPLAESVVIGLAMSISSSAVLSRALSDRGLAHSAAGRLAIGWAVVEDMMTVVVLAMLPVLEGGAGGEALRETGIATAKAVGFVVVMFVGGTRVVPPLLRYSAAFGSREVFIVTVVALALGIAATATAFDVSIALGAFVAGVVISETEMGHQATADVLPLREAFAVLFFVSVGMLLDPSVVADNGWLLAAVVGIVVLGRAAGASLFVSFFPQSARTSLLVGAGVAQIGEFSFLIAGAGLDQGTLTDGSYNVVLAAAVASIAVNPLLFMAVPASERWLQHSGPLWRFFDRQGPDLPATAPRPGQPVILGFGRVGALTGHALDSAGIRYVVVESDIELSRRLASAGRAVVWGDAANLEVLEQAGVASASLLVVALPDEASTVLAITNARRLAPRVPIVVRAQGSEALAALRGLDVQDVVVPEYEGGLELMRQALLCLGFSDDDVEGYRLATRDVHYGPPAAT